MRKPVVRLKDGQAGHPSGVTDAAAGMVALPAFDGCVTPRFRAAGRTPVVTAWRESRQSRFSPARATAWVVALSVNGLMLFCWMGTDEPLFLRVLVSEPGAESTLHLRFVPPPPRTPDASRKVVVSDHSPITSPRMTAAPPRRAHAAPLPASTPERETEHALVTEPAVPEHRIGQAESSSYASPLLRSSGDVMTRKPGRITYAPTRFDKAWRGNGEAGKDTLLKRLVQGATAHWSMHLPGAGAMDCVGGVGGPATHGTAIPLSSVGCRGRAPPAPSNAAETIRIQTLPPVH